MVHITCMNFEVTLCGSSFYMALPFVIPNNNDNIHQMTGRRACDVISATKRIFVHSFVKPKNIRLVGFDIRFTTNARNEEWNTNDRTNTDGCALNSVFNDLGLSLVSKNCGTRPSSHSNPSLDLVLSNAPDVFDNCIVGMPLTDHCPVICSASWSALSAIYRSVSGATKGQTRENTTEKRTINFNKLRTILSTMHLEECILGEDVHIDYRCMALCSSLDQAIARSTLVTNKTFRVNTQPWFTSSHRKNRQRVSRLYKLHRRDLHNPTLKAAYILCRNEYRYTIRKARDSYLSTLGTSRLSKGRAGGYSWWKRAKKICNIGSKPRGIQLLADDDGTHTSSKAKAEILCEFFRKQCTANSSNQQPSRCPSSSTIDDQEQFSFTKIKSTDVYEAARTLSVHKSSADSYLSNAVLSRCADILCVPLAKLFNYSLEQGEFPSAWKMATIIPMYKEKGCPTHPTNYRPISLLPCIAKLFEKIVAKQLQAYLTIKQKICSQQYAYVKEKSAIDQLIILTQQMADYIDERLNFDLVSLDFCKAFDRVSHSTLLRQVSKFSDHKVTAWTKSYLQDRSIAVKIESCMSVPKVTNCGVPQGSHLSPLLFVIYINDLPEAIHHSHTFLFADDVTLLLPYKGSLSSPGIQADIHACQNWARERGGEFSPSKTSVLSFRYKPAAASSPAPTSATYTMEGLPLPSIDILKHLGVRFSADLNFRQHYLDISRKFKQRVSLLCHMAHRLTPQAMMLLYKCYVRPVIEYSVVVWSFRLRSSDLTELDRVQARFARSYLRKRKIQIDFNTPKQDLNKKANIESLLYRRQFLSLVTMHKFIFKYRRCLASFHFNITQSARRPNKIILPKAKTTSKSLFLFQTSLLWNCLPPRLTAEPSIIVFKNELRKLTCKHSASLSGMPTPCT